MYFPSNCHVMSRYHAGCSVWYYLTLMLITAGWHRLWSVWCYCCDSTEEWSTLTSLSLLMLVSYRTFENFSMPRIMFIWKLLWKVAILRRLLITVMFYYTFAIFTFVWPCCIATNFFIIKPTRCTNFTNLFWHETLHVSDSSILVLLESFLQTCMTYTVAECTVNELLIMNRGTVRNM
jgi:hypothetical protein